MNHHSSIAALALCVLIVPPCLARQPELPSVLVFSRTEGFRHDSIEPGIAAIAELGDANGFSVVTTEDDAYFTANDLSGFAAIVFLNTTGDVLDADEEAAFEAYIRGGGGFAGIHSAADTEYDWAWYGGLVGAYFDSHPPGTPTATVYALDRAHPATASLPVEWTRTDEWYNYSANPRHGIHVLMTVDESTYSGGTMGADHPIAWCHVYDGGRVFYTGGGHTSESYSDANFRQHILNGILFAAGEVPGDCGATVASNYEKVVLDASAWNPMALEVASDGRVFYVEREGALKLYNPNTTATTTIEIFHVFSGLEDGLQGIALDPEFDDNGWMYLFYSPAGAQPIQRVSRFTFDGESLSNEMVIFEIDVQRDQCCHSAGELEFDADGNLYIGVGDNTNPFESSGFSPIDERAGREAWDAQRTSANTHDLRGKILRITPEDDGSYSIPAGNLFPADGSQGRPEIYVMGVRNPFRINPDPTTGFLYWGDVGPDAAQEAAGRGPAGLDEWNRTREPGNFGWPYCIGPNLAYNDYDFATSTSGTPFNCAVPMNASPNNTGATSLPAAQPAWIWYPYSSAIDHPQIPDGPGRTAMAGPTYTYNPSQESDVAFPAYFDRIPLLFEWSRGFVLEARLDESGDLVAIQPMLTDLEFKRPMAMEFGPDGALYVLDWGTDFGGDNADAQLVRVNYRGGITHLQAAEPDIAPAVEVVAAFPNPAAETLTIEFTLRQTGRVSVEVVDLLGRRVERVGERVYPAGSNQVSIPVLGLAAGTYLYRLVTGDGSVSGRFTVAR